MRSRSFIRLVGGLVLSLALTAAATGAAGAETWPPPVGDVPMIRQQYSLDCEAAALQMALAHEGIGRSQPQLLAAMGVDLRHPGAGYRGGGDPYRSFVGRPGGSEVRRTGYGAYFPVVASAAAAAGGRVLLAGERVPVTAVYDQVLTGHPAIVWVTYDFRLHPRHDYLAWDGRWVPYAGPYEHTVTVVGFDGATVLVNDPARGVSRLGKLTFEAGYGVYDGMAVVLR